MEKLNGETMNIVADNIEKLKQIFPDAFSEDKIDFKVLQELLGKNIETENERYSFSWNGKTEARRIAQTPSTGTLRPCEDESKNYIDTNNMYIEGDNLEVLKLLQKSYHGKIKMIYIDPPYNTGKDFVYKDNFKDNLKNYLEITGQVGEEGQKLSTNSDTSGRYHSDWLNMMYPRLKLARNLLSDDGVIFISIDDNEITNLKKLCDEIYGEENLINQVIWQRNSSGKTVTRQLPVNCEYLLIYCKSGKYNLKPIYKPLAEATIRMYAKDDNDGRGKYRLYPLQKTSTPGPATTYDYLDNNGKIWNCPAKGWRMNKDKLKELENEGRLCLENSTLSEKAYWEERDSEGKMADTLWNDISENSVANREMIELLKTEVFSNPKPIALVDRCLKMCGNNSVILDFFSGSATTAHAVMQLNAEDGGDRKYIMVQLPEVTVETSEAHKAGYKNICEIGKKRIRRAGEKIKSDESLPLENRKKLDTGFKVFKLDSSNIKTWDGTTDNLERTLLDSIDNIKLDRSPLDVLYEILLKYGLDLNISIVKKDEFYSIGGGTLLINLDKKIDMSVIESICAEYKLLVSIDSDYKSTVVLRDNAFANSVDKSNAIQKLKQAGIKEVRSI